MDEATAKINLYGKERSVIMNFYILNLKFNDDYDTIQSQVVRANSEDEARKLANLSVGDEGRVWENPEEVGCELLDPDGAAEVILTDYKA